MSVAKKLITAIALLSLTTSAQAYTPDSQEYKDALSQYGKTLFGARYTSKLCGKYGISFNEPYFRVGPPNLWDAKAYDQFMGAVMTTVKLRMDNKYVELGEDNFCKSMIVFFKETYRDAVRPVKFSN